MCAYVAKTFISNPTISLKGFYHEKLVFNMLLEWKNVLQNGMIFLVKMNGSREN